MALIKAKQLDLSGVSIAASAFTPTQVVAGNPLTVPQYHQWLLYVQELLLDDDLTLEGDLVMLL